MAWNSQRNSTKTYGSDYKTVWVRRFGETRVHFRTKFQGTSSNDRYSYTAYAISEPYDADTDGGITTIIIGIMVYNSYDRKRRDIFGRPFRDSGATAQRTNDSHQRQRDTNRPSGKPTGGTYNVSSTRAHCLLTDVGWRGSVNGSHGNNVRSGAGYWDRSKFEDRVRVEVH